MPVSIRKDIALRVIPYYDRLISLQGDDPAARAGVAKTLLLRARLRHALGTTSEDHEAIADCLEAARLYAEAPPTPDNAFGRAQALASIGAILGPQRRFLEAIARLTVAQEILDGLVAAQPDRKDYRFQFAKCLSNEANCHRFLGQQHAAASPAGDAAREFRAAERAYSDAIGHVQQLVRRFPDEARFREWLARIWGNLGDLYLARSDLDEATRSAEAGRALQQGRQIAIALDREFPGVTSIQDCLVILSLNYGEYLKNGGRSAEAVAEYSRASLVYDRLHDRHPDQREFRWGQALAQARWGWPWRSRTPSRRRDSTLEEAARQYDALVADYPAVLQIATERGATYDAMAQLELRSGSIAEASRLIARAIRVQLELLAAVARTDMSREEKRTLLAQATLKLAADCVGWIRHLAGRLRSRDEPGDLRTRQGGSTRDAATSEIGGPRAVLRVRPGNRRGDVDREDSPRSYTNLYAGLGVVGPEGRRFDPFQVGSSL